MLQRVAGRPVLARMDLAAWRRRTMSRCQRRIVSGVTSNRRPRRRVLGITLSRVPSRARSAPVQLRATRLPPLQDRELVAQDQDPGSLPRLLAPDSRSHPVSCVVRRNTNRKHMTGDHHGRNARRATLLVRAVDALLSTRTDRRAEPGGRCAGGVTALRVVHGRAGHRRLDAIQHRDHLALQPQPDLHHPVADRPGQHAHV
jgi:hypothetical protein